MKKLLLFLLATSLCLACAHADDNVKSVQTKLREGGFYFGDATGVYDSETAAAVTRFQIRRGLSISGRLDAATAEALGVAASTTEATEPAPESGTWRRLRNGDMQFLKKLNAGEIAPPKPAAQASPPPAETTVTKVESRTKTQTRETAPPAAGPAETGGVYGRERLRDYVGAFVLAGLDPQIGAELEFFAEGVNYFGEANVSRQKIRADLLRYDRKWPQRRFWLAGEVEVQPQPDGKFRVTFPLRYELRNGPKHSSGKVLKTLVLRKAREGDLEIVGVNERKS
ncbi:MAG: peptidoglycan-binding protein [Verrucomicrobiota bacterium]|nr:peptidoglycan-binding protein [Chthoniobacterales bacterium]MDQ3413853.1 peptidoglycan-binding protein [Verrucomicrobiota bacterium]